MKTTNLELQKGVKKRIEFTRKLPCHRCNGTGFLNKARTEFCDYCDCKGFIIARKQGSVTIPSGSQDGLTLRIAGYGNILHIGETPGDLFVRCVTELPPGKDYNSSFETNEGPFFQRSEQGYRRGTEHNHWQEDWRTDQGNYEREDEPGEYDYGSNQPNFRRPYIFRRRRGRNDILFGIMDAIFLAIAGFYLFTYIGGVTVGIFGAVLGAIGGFFLGYKLGAVCFCI